MIKIDWMLGYANLPRIILEDQLDFMPREECEFEFKDGMWWHIQENGLVRYMAHSGLDKNEGGFGGAVFTIRHNDELKTLKGPWSSRAAWLNTLLPEDKQVADVILDNGKQYRSSCGVLVSELANRWDTDAYLLRALNTKEGPEQGSFTASMAPDCILKPDGQRIDVAQSYEVIKEPVSE